MEFIIQEQRGPTHTVVHKIKIEVAYATMGIQINGQRPYAVTLTREELNYVLKYPDYGHTVASSLR